MSACRLARCLVLLTAASLAPDAVHCVGVAVVPLPVLDPSRDHYVPLNRNDNVTYTCSVNTSVANLTVEWEIGSFQIRPDDVDAVAGMGYHVNGVGSTYSTILITERARISLKSIPVQCRSVVPVANSIPLINQSKEFRVITFDAPQAPENVSVEASGVMPILQWNRVPGPVENYTVQVVLSEDGALVLENTTSSLNFSLQEIEQEIRYTNQSCEIFQFSVKATNEAGTGPLSTAIMDTIPISPDVTNISNNLAVERVQLRPLSAVISFPRVIPCRTDFTLRNYTVRIDGQMVVVVPADGLLLSPVIRMINNTNLPSIVTLDDSFSLDVTVCSNVSCRTSTPKNFNTTDVQYVEVVFYDRLIFIRCSFATDSQAQGCRVTLPLVGSNQTDMFNINRENGSICGTTNNTLRAYGTITVTGIKQDGTTANISLTVIPVDAGTLDNFTNRTGCTAPTPLPPEVEMIVNAGATAGVVAGSVTVVIVIIVIVVIILIIIIKRKKELTGREYSLARFFNKKYSKTKDTLGGPPPPPTSEELKLFDVSSLSVSAAEGSTAQLQLIKENKEADVPTEESRIEGDGGGVKTKMPRIQSDSAPAKKTKPESGSPVKQSSEPQEFEIKCTYSKGDNTIHIYLMAFVDEKLGLKTDIEYKKLKLKIE